MRLILKMVVALVLSSGFQGDFYSLGQDFANDTFVRTEFQKRLELMVEELGMTDSVEIVFFDIYTEYGVFMKEAYENRVGWIRLYHQYEWASRGRDTKMKIILNESQFNCFVRHQREIEQEARKNR